MTKEEEDKIKDSLIRQFILELNKTKKGQKRLAEIMTDITIEYQFEKVVGGEVSYKPLKFEIRNKPEVR